MADESTGNFGGADGGDTVDVGGNPGDGRDLNGAANNGEPGSPSNPAAFKRGRGRPPGSGRKSAESGGNGEQEGKIGGKKSTKLDVEVFATQLVGAHKMLALVTKNALWIISEKEALALATAMLDVMKYHAINIDPANLAYLKLMGVILMVHGTRLFTIMQMKKKEAERTVDMV